MARIRRLSPKSQKFDQEGADLFEKFALEEGIWKLVGGQLVDGDCGYLTQDQIKYRFTQWKKKRSKTTV